MRLLEYPLFSKDDIVIINNPDSILHDLKGYVLSKDIERSRDAIYFYIHVYRHFGMYKTSIRQEHLRLEFSGKTSK